MDTAAPSYGIFNTLKAKLIFAFTLILLILAAIGFTAYLVFKSADDGFKSYRELARDSNLASTLQSNMLMVRMNVKDFLLTGSDKDIRQYTQYFDEVDRLMSEAKNEINKPERTQMDSQLIQELEQYNATFNVIKAYRVRRDELVLNQLNIIGPQMERELTQIMQSAAQSNNTQLAYLAGEAMRNLLLGRLYVVKYLESNELSAFDRVNTEFSLFDDQLTSISTFNLNTNTQQRLDSIMSKRSTYMQAFNEVQDIIVDRNDKVTNVLDVIGPRFVSLVRDLSNSVKTDQDILGPQLKASNEQAVSQIFFLFMTALVISVAIIFILLRMVMKQLSKDPNKLDNIDMAISKGDLDQEYDERAPQGVFKSMLAMRQNLRLIREKEAQERIIARVNARIKSALDNANSNVMIADKNLNIIYANHALKTTMQSAENDIQAQIGQFDAHNLIGFSVEQFYFEPEQQRLLFNNPSSAHNSTEFIGERVFSVTSNPIEVNGERIGTVLEWTDRTAEVNIEKEIDTLVQSAAQGDLSQKLTIEGKSGFFEALSTGLNDLISTVEVALNDVTQVLSALAQGDLSQRITNNYEG